MPFRLDGVEKYKKIHKLNTTQKKQTMQNTANKNYPGKVTCYGIQPGPGIEVAYSTMLPKSTRGEDNKITDVLTITNKLQIKAIPFM